MKKTKLAHKRVVIAKKKIGNKTAPQAARPSVPVVRPAMSARGR